MLNDHDAKRINKELIEAQSSIKFTLVGYVVVNSDGQWLVDAENATFNTDMMDSILFVRAIDAEKIAKLYPGAKVEHFLHIVTTV